MPNIHRHLIVTSDERTWKFDRPVIFLGEWCRTYDRRHIWQNMDAIVAAPYGLGKKLKESDLKEARALEDKIFPALRNILNQHHNLQNSERFWRIVLGHWVRRYVDVMLNRTKTLEQCIQNYQISSITAYANEHYQLALHDSYAAIWAFNDNLWNNTLSIRILELLKSVSCSIETTEGTELADFSFNSLIATSTSKRKILKWAYCQAGKFLSFFVRDNDAFIINSYLPKKDEIKLQLSLRQCPQLWSSSKLEAIEKPDRGLRERLSKKFSSTSDDQLEIILGLMLFELLPVCYLEGFAGLNKLAKKQPWPKSPKFIFTSNNFDTDEVFKLWTASKVETGSKYFTGQHGNNYGTYRYMYPTLEETTADKFLTWGWREDLPQHTPAFVFKTALRKKEHYNPQGGLLLIELHSPQRLNTWDDNAEFSNYFFEQQIFAGALTSKAKQQLTIRLHAAYKYKKWNEQARWQAFDPSLKIDTGSVAIQKLIARSRMVVHSYDSTGILETLYQNIPTLAFWQNGLDHLRDSAKPYYQSLVDIGIIHFSAQSAADKVNEIWDNVEYWWAGSEIQDARKKFCDRYSKSSQNPVSDLKLIFTENC